MSKAMILNKIATVTVVSGVLVASTTLATISHQVLAQQDAKTKQRQPAPTPPEQPKTEVAEKPRLDQFGDPLPEGAIARLGTVRFRCEREPCSIAFSPDNKVLAASTPDGQVFFWNASTGKEIRRFQVGDPKYHLTYTTIDFSPGGKVLAALSLGGAELWEVSSGKQLLKLLSGGNGRGMPSPIRFSPDGKMLAFPEEQGVTLFESDTGKKLRHFADGQLSLGSLAISPDGKIVAVGTAQTGPVARVVRLFDTGTGALIREFTEAVDGGGDAVAFSPDGKTLAWTGSAIILSDVATGKEIAKLGKHQPSSHYLAFTSDGKSLISGDRDAKVRVWDVARRMQRRELDAHEWFGECTALSRDGTTVAMGAAYCAVRVWDVVTGKELSGRFDGHDNRINAVAFSPDGKRFVSAGDDQQIRVWDTTTWRQQRLIKARVGTVAFSPDSQILASVPGVCPYDAVENYARLWNVATGKELTQLDHGDDLLFNSIAFTQDGKRILSADGEVHTWDPATGKHLRRFSITNSPQAKFSSSDFLFSPNGKLVAVPYTSRAGAVIRLWDIAHEKEILSLFSAEYYEPEAFSPDSRVLACCSRDLVTHMNGSADKDIHFWELASGKEILQLKGKVPPGSVRFSPSGRMVAWVDGETIRLLDVATGKQVQKLGGHHSGVTCLAFAPDGKQLASGLSNTSVLVWALEEPSKPLEAKNLAVADLKPLWSVLASPDAPKAYAAIWPLVAAPEQSIPFLKDHLRPATNEKLKRLPQLIADLDSNAFATREAASGELEKLLPEAEPALRKALAGQPSLEQRRRIEALIALPSGVVRDPEVLRGVRAIQVLESIGTPDAKKVLETIAAGAPDARLTQEAKASLDRLSTRIRRDK